MLELQGVLILGKLITDCVNKTFSDKCTSMKTRILIFTLLALSLVGCKTNTIHSSRVATVVNIDETLTLTLPPHHILFKKDGKTFIRNKAINYIEDIVILNTNSNTLIPWVLRSSDEEIKKEFSKISGVYSERFYTSIVEYKVIKISDKQIEISMILDRPTNALDGYVHVRVILLRNGLKTTYVFAQKEKNISYYTHKNAVSHVYLDSIVDSVTFN